MRAFFQALTCIGVFAAVLIPAEHAWSQSTGTSTTQPASTTALSPQWEELTGPDFIHAIQQAQGVCVLPFGIIEKHGTQLPLGTDLIDVRYASLQAAKQEYAVVFPPYYFGQIAEARHEPGTVSYSAPLQMELLQATTNEMSRNGCKKVVIVNGHGGNESLLPYFAQSQLDSPKDYVVYIYGLQHHAAALQDKVDEHAGGSRALIWCTWTASDRSQAPIRTGCIFRPACTPASGGMRSSRITTPASPNMPLLSWVNRI
jgi:Creatinine amidohydrolase